MVQLCSRHHIQYTDTDHDIWHVLPVDTLNPLQWPDLLISLATVSLCLVLSVPRDGSHASSATLPLPAPRPPDRGTALWRVSEGVRSLYELVQSHY